MSTNDGLIFYKSFYEAIELLETDEQLELYKAIPNYVFNNEEPSFEGSKKAIWVLIKPQLLANLKKQKNGKKGGRPKKETEYFEEENLDIFQ